MGIGTTYSFKDVVGAISNPLFGVSILLTGGNIGNGSITISMGTERTTHDIAADGTVMPSYIAGNNGTVTIECQQTSVLHKALLNLYNLAATAADLDDIAGWAATNISIRTLLDGSSHQCTGVSFSKVPEKTYKAPGGNITWSFMAANIVNTGSVGQTIITSVLSGLGL